jgi:PKD repeat protein/glutamine cyclotransferase
MRPNPEARNQHSLPTLSKIMKIISRSYLRPLRRSLCTVLIGIAALWAMPGSARAQQQALLVSQSAQNAINEYDATTGALIKANFITGIISPSGMLLSGNTLYVASGEVNGGFINTYNATTGSLIKANFISNSGLFGQINGAANLGLVGTTLYVANNFVDTISTYDATTGASINTPLIYGGGASPELRGPYGLVILGNNLFVSNNDSSGGWVGKYDLSGAPINDHFISISGIGAYGLAISGNHLFVATGRDLGSSVEEYDVTTGALLNANFISGLQYVYGLTISGSTLYVSQNYGRPDGQSVVSTYDVNTGTLLNANFVTGLNGGDNFMLVVTPQPPQPPIANAGVGKTVQAGTLVTLNGGGSSDPSGQLPLTYAWSFVSQAAGSTAVLSDSAIVNPTFTPNAEGNYVIQLVVTDAAGLSSLPASVTISTIDAPPVANAGPSQTITATGTLVHLDGTQSFDLAGLPITYQWSFVSKPAGSNAVLSGPTTANPSFTLDVLGDYSIQLVVTDSLGTSSSPATVQVSFNDVAPIANAGSNQSAVVGATVTLNGSKSTDTDGEPLTYKWSVVSAPSGSKAAISNPTAKIASFVPDLPGTFVVQLIVNDGFLKSLPATAEIVAVSQQSSLIAQIQERQGVIATLPDDAFKFKGARAFISLELNAVLLSVEAHDYRVALVLLQGILAQADGCATIGRPDNNDLITNCPDQSEFYPALLNIAAEVRALVPPR